MTLWEAAITTLLKVEGGYVNDPRDPGGETKYGISRRSYPNLDIARLTREDAVAIYERDFWTPIPADLPDALRWMAFDAAVNHGLGLSRGWLAGSDTLDAFTAKRLQFYTHLDDWPTFGRGWIRRVATVLAAITAREATLAAAPDTGLHAADTLVLDRLTLADRARILFTTPSVLRGALVWRARDGKLDARRSTPARTLDTQEAQP